MILEQKLDKNQNIIVAFIDLENGNFSNNNQYTEIEKLKKVVKIRKVKRQGFPVSL